MGEKEEKGDAVPEGEQEKETLAGEGEKKVIFFLKLKYLKIWVHTYGYH